MCLVWWPTIICTFLPADERLITLRVISCCITDEKKKLGTVIFFTATDFFVSFLKREKRRVKKKLSKTKLFFFLKLKLEVNREEDLFSISAQSPSAHPTVQYWLYTICDSVYCSYRPFQSCGFSSEVGKLVSARYAVWYDGGLLSVRGLLCILYY